MSRADLADQSCTIARAVETIGDPWTLMILREMFLGVRRFDDFQRHTGGAPHTLSTRLKRLEEIGAIRREPYQDRPLRHEYRLTEKGRDLWPVIIALKGWGDKCTVLRSEQASGGPKGAVRLRAWSRAAGQGGRP